MHTSSSFFLQDKKRRKQKRLHASASSKVSGFIHELDKFVNESDLESQKEDSDANNLTSTEGESDVDAKATPSNGEEEGNALLVQTETMAEEKFDLEHPLLRDQIDVSCNSKEIFKTIASCAI